MSEANVRERIAGYAILVRRPFRVAAVIRVVARVQRPLRDLRLPGLWPYGSRLGRRLL
jgi:hypothetical protein